MYSALTVWLFLSFISLCIKNIKKYHSRENASVEYTYYKYSMKPLSKLLRSII
jgi:hypothetical protein